MDTWLTAIFSKDKFTVQQDTICQALVSRCGALVVPMSDGTVEYRMNNYGTKQLTQKNILLLQGDADMELKGSLFESYYIILPLSLAEADVPVGFPDRTYEDEVTKTERTRKVKDYVAFYRISKDGKTALVRCTHKPKPDSPSAVSLDPSNLKLWSDVAKGVTEHTVEGLIESKEAHDLMSPDGPYGVEEL